VREPGASGARLNWAVFHAVRERLAKRGIEQYAWTLGADGQLDLIATALGANVEAAATHERISCQHRDVKQQLDGVLWQLLVADYPTEFNPSLGPEQAFERDLGFARVDLLAESSGRAKGQPEEFQLIGRSACAVGEQLEAFLPHLGVSLVGKQLDTVIECADRRHEVVAKPRAKQTGEIDRVHRKRLMGQSLISRKLPTLNGRDPIPISRSEMGGIQTIDVRLEPAHAGWRLDRALAAAVPTLSRERLKALIRSGAVEAEGRPVRDPATKVRGQEALRVAVPAPRPAHNEAQDIPLTILFEDEHLLIVDKPAGLVVHPAAGNFDRTLVNALLHHCAGKLSGIGGVARPGIVHRIDKDTSGLLVVAKTDVAHEGLAKQFAAHSIDRRYLAIVSGVPKASEGVIDAPLARSATNRKKIAIVAGRRGKRAVTHWKRLRLLKDAALVECRLETGRTHQVRVHMASIGHPLVGDPVYGRSGKTHGKLLKDLGFHRQALHAAELGFTHPVTKNRLAFSSPMPPDTQELLSALGV